MVHHLRMPRKPCYWTRKLELELVEFIQQREFVWKPVGNTNHHIQQKYKAYAEFAARLGRGFTARSVRDRWVNIRSTFNHNLRRVDKSKETARSAADIYVPCWPLWNALQFLRSVTRKEDGYVDYPLMSSDFKELSNINVKEELPSDMEDLCLTIRQRGQRTNRPRKRKLITKVKNSKCKRIIDDLIRAMKPLTSTTQQQDQSYWFFGKHVTERLNNMRDVDSDIAIREIMRVLEESTPSESYMVDNEDINSSQNLI